MSNGPAYAFLKSQLDAQTNAAAQQQAAMATSGESAPPMMTTAGTVLRPIMSPTAVPQEQSFFSKYKIPLIIGGAVVVGGIAFFATR